MAPRAASSEAARTSAQARQNEFSVRRDYDGASYFRRMLTDGRGKEVDTFEDECITSANCMPECPCSSTYKSSVETMGTPLLSCILSAKIPFPRRGAPPRRYSIQDPPAPPWCWLSRLACLPGRAVYFLLSDVNVRFYTSDHSLHTIIFDGNGDRLRGACSLTPSATSAAILTVSINHCCVIDHLHPTVYAYLEA